MYKALCIIKPMPFRTYISSFSRKDTRAALLILYASQKMYKFHKKFALEICVEISEVNHYYIKPLNRWVSPYGKLYSTEVLSHILDFHMEMLLGLPHRILCISLL